MSVRTLSCLAAAAMLAAAASCGAPGTPTGTGDAGSPGAKDAATGGGADASTSTSSDVGSSADTGTTIPPDGGGTDVGGAADGGAPADAGPTGPSPAISCAFTPTFDPNFTPVQLCDAFAKLQCDRLGKCCLLAAKGYAACVGFFKRDCEQKDTSARITAGLWKVDQSKVKACLEAEAKRLSCDKVDRMDLPECAESIVFAPGSPIGGKCLIRDDCVNGRCARPSGTCGGACAAYRAVGESCNSSDLACDFAAAYCKYPSGASAGTCTAVLAQGATCANDPECGSANFCSGDAARVCKARIAAGAPCTPNDNCIQGHRCTGTCVLTRTSPIGKGCLSNKDCVVDAFCKKTAGATFGTCTGLLAAGSACGSDSECDHATLCTGGLKTCVAKVEAGAACGKNSECKYGLACMSKKCVRLSDEGEACTSTDHCRFGLRCDGAKCMAPGGAGSPCASHFHCDQSYCDKAASKCAALLGDGTACKDDEDCKSADCESSVCRPNCTF
jgi:hypothetical protein